MLSLGLYLSRAWPLVLHLKDLQAFGEIGTSGCLTSSPQPCPDLVSSLPRLACQAMRQLHPEAIAAIQSKALFSKAEEQLLSKVGSVRVRASEGGEGAVPCGSWTAWKTDVGDLSAQKRACAVCADAHTLWAVLEKSRPGFLGSRSCHFSQLLVGMHGG